MRYTLLAMSSRDEILAALRRNAPPATPAPALDGLGLPLADPISQLATAMRAVGGAFVHVPDLADAAAAIAALPHVAAARQVISLVPDLAASTVDLAAIRDPRDLATLELAILPGELAVAENAAVWVDGRALPHRALFVIPDHLILVVAATAVVPDMHAAYARLAGRPPGHGLFISGPSKTADIEQVLVIGAQGARTCTLVLLGASG